MPDSIHRGNHIFQDDVSFTGNFYPPSAAITNSHFSSDANNRLAVAKMIHRLTPTYTVGPTTTVAAGTFNIHLAHGAGTIIGVNIRPQTSPTGGDLAYTVDVKRAVDASSTYNTILSGVVTISSADTSQTKQIGTLASTTFAAGDAFQVVIAVSGSTGTQGLGLLVTLLLDENPS